MKIPADLAIVGAYWVLLVGIVLGAVLVGW